MLCFIFWDLPFYSISHWSKCVYFTVVCNCNYPSFILTSVNMIQSIYPLCVQALDRHDFI